jgi:hypothetical protein
MSYSGNSSRLCNEAGILLVNQYGMGVASLVRKGNQSRMSSPECDFDEMINDKEFEQITQELCERALNDAKEQLHPLLRDVELERLEKRSEFMQAFRQALELMIAKKLAMWQPGVQAVFKFDESWMESRAAWDGSVHLLVKVPRVSNVIQSLGKRLDRGLMKYLRQLGWSRFRKKISILEIQQVTPNELRYGIGYGAMFWAVYSAPVKVWSR